MRRNEKGDHSGGGHTASSVTCQRRDYQVNAGARPGLLGERNIDHAYKCEKKKCTIQVTVDGICAVSAAMFSLKPFLYALPFHVILNVFVDVLWVVVQVFVNCVGVQI